MGGAGIGYGADQTIPRFGGKSYQPNYLLRALKKLQIEFTPAVRD
jgi:hypothetical protein